MHIFMISMPQPGPRRHSAIQKLQASGLRFEIVDGVECGKWRESELPLSRPLSEASLNVGEVGCYQAHLRALQRITDYRLPWACILEDDFCFEAEPDFGLHNIESCLPADFHYIHLQRDLDLNSEYRKLSRQGAYYRIDGTPLCTTGYIITQPLAHYILEHHRLCEMPIDHLYNQLSHRGNFYALVNPIVGIQLGLEAVIQR